MPLPTFVIAGTVRGATTSLHYYLEQHPAIGMSTIKEPNYFLFDEAGQPFVADRGIVTKSVPDRREYEALFNSAATKPARGEASPLYLYTRETPKRLSSVVPDAKVIAILREPVSRAWSHFLHLYRGDPAAAGDRFREAVEPELAKADVYEPYKAGHHFLRIGRYAEQIERYHRTFGAENVLALDYADVERDPAGVLARVCSLLDVDDSYPFDVETVYNTSGVVRSRALGRVQMRVAKVQPYAKRVLPRTVVRRAGRIRARLEQRTFEKPAPLPDDLIALLQDWYAPDISRLEALLGRDLPAWRRT